MRRLTFPASIAALLVFLSSNCLAEPSSLVTVRGEAELNVPADRAMFEAVILSDGETPEQALKENAARTEKVLIALQRAGLDEKEITSGHFVVDPVWSQQPRKAPEDWKPAIVGYSVANYLRVKTVRIDTIGTFIAAAVKAGCDEINGLRFDLADPRRYRQETIRLATERAREDAAVLAVAADTTLGPVVSLNLDNARAVPHPSTANRAFMAEADMAPAIRPGEVTVRASVTAVYQLIAEGGER